MEKPQSPLSSEECIEQAYFFRIYRERMQDNVPSQEILRQLEDEVLSTTNLPMAINFLLGEIQLTGGISEGMQQLKHYFTPFQTFIVSQAEDDYSKFDLRTGLEILEREATYRSKDAKQAGLFIFQFECIARNRLGYQDGLDVIAADPMYDETWQTWIRSIRHQLGTVDFSDILFLRSEFWVDQKRRRQRDFNPQHSILFGIQEGRIAHANRGKDPLYMFSALQRQLGYPEIPRPQPKSEAPAIHPVLEMRLQRMEQKLKILEQEVKGGGLDLTEFYKQADNQIEDD